MSRFDVLKKYAPNHKWEPTYPGSLDSFQDKGDGLTASFIGYEDDNRFRALCFGHFDIADESYGFPDFDPEDEHANQIDLTIGLPGAGLRVGEEVDFTRMEVVLEKKYEDAIWFIMSTCPMPTGNLKDVWTKLNELKKCDPVYLSEKAASTMGSTSKNYRGFY